MCFCNPELFERGKKKRGESLSSGDKKKNADSQIFSL